MTKKFFTLVTALVLAVGAWAENLWSGDPTEVSYYGFTITESATLSVGDVLTFTITEKGDWASITLKTIDRTPGWGQPGTDLASVSAEVGTVKLVVTEAIAAAASDGLWIGGGWYKVSSVDYEKKQARLNIFSGSQAVNWWGVQLPKAMFGAVATGDLLKIAVSVADGANLKVTSKDGGDGNEEFASISLGSTAPTTVKIAFTDEMVAAAKDNGLYMNGNGYTYTSVNIIYTPAVNINASAGYATFSYAADLDLTGIDAYTAAVSGGKVVLTSIQGKKIAAGIGIILKGSGDVEIPLTTESPDEITGNELLVSDGTVTGDESTIYVLANGKNGVGFYLLKSGQKVPAGKAYLETTASAREFLGFGDDSETTAISTMNREPLTNNQYYDLQGRRVAQPQKGLYVVNGKKVIFK